MDCIGNGLVLYPHYGTSSLENRKAVLFFLILRIFYLTHISFLFFRFFFFASFHSVVISSRLFFLSPYFLLLAWCWSLACAQPR